MSKVVMRILKLHINAGDLVQGINRFRYLYYVRTWKMELYLSSDRALIMISGIITLATAL